MADTGTTSTNDNVQENITAFWSTVASGYEAHAGNVPERDSTEFQAWNHALARLLPPAPADVLDIATGTGFVALIAAGLGHRVTGIDLSEPMLAEARAGAARLGLEVRFAIEDAVSPNLKAGEFDAITSRHFLWTLREPVITFRNWLRLLRPGGRVVAIDSLWFRDQPTTDEPASQEGIFGRHYTSETRAALPVMALSDPAPIVEMFRSAGFADVALSDLADVHAVAKDPASRDPWYVITAARS